MKITVEHYAHIARALNEIKPLILQARAAYKNSGLSDKRFQWDMLRQANLIAWVCDNIYPYANDDHIDTALRQYFSKLGV
jgi:hypothetical protein